VREPVTGLRCVVLGASGFVGKHVVLELEARGHQVTAVGAPRIAASRADLVGAVQAADDSSSVEQALVETFRHAEVVINAAGLASPDGDLDGDLVGANASLPLVLARAATRSGTRRMIHLSSAAVQGRTSVLDETWTTSPFSAYSHSKAWGEELLARQGQQSRAAGTEIVVLRATSVQGTDRTTTVRLRRLAASPLASVASPGTAPSPVTSVHALAELVASVAAHEGPVPEVVLQPWEGMTVTGVLEAAGGRMPRSLPAVLCRIAVFGGRVGSRLLRGRFSGAVRRVEVMWFGQGQVLGWASEAGLTTRPRVADVLRGSASSS